MEKGAQVRIVRVSMFVITKITTASCQKISFATNWRWLRTREVLSSRRIAGSKA